MRHKYQLSSGSVFLASVACSLLLSIPLTHAACGGDPKMQYCPGVGGCIPITSICLLEPLFTGVPAEITAATAATPLGAFQQYLNGQVWDWAFGMGVAIAILNGVFAGFRIVMSNGDSGEIGAAKTQFLWSAIGLIILLLAGVILQFLNPWGFLNV